MDLVAAKFEVAHQANNSGNALKGAHLLQDFQDVLFPNRLAERR